MPQKFPLQRRLAQFFSIVIGAYSTLSLLLAIWLMEGALHLQRLPIRERNSFAHSVAGLSTSGPETVTAPAIDGVNLSAWYVRPDHWNGNSVILLHGMGDNRQGVVSYAPMFLRADYAVLLPDSRAHGASGGDMVTYGLLESGDIGQWSKWLAARSSMSQPPQSAGCLYLFGESLGAALALQAAPTAPHLCAVVAEASFANFREIGYERIAQALGSTIAVSHIMAWPTVNLAFVYARTRYGLDFNQASPEEKLAESHVPALLIAGRDDTNIPARHSIRIAARAGLSAQLWLVPGAGHTLAASAAPAEFQRRVLDWFRTHPNPVR